MTEGFSKVPVEALFHGVVPLLSDLPLNKQIVGDGTRGRCFPHADAAMLAKHLVELSRAPSLMRQMIDCGREYAQTLTLEAWQQHIKKMLEEHWAVELTPSRKV